MNDDPPETDPAPPSGAPRGAIFVTTFVTLVILAFWFGSYLFTLARS